MADILAFAQHAKALKPSECEGLLELLRDFRDGADLAAPPEERSLAGKLLELAERRMALGERWRFVMIDPDRYDEVVDFLAANSRRPVVALKLWAKLFRKMSEPGEVLTSRKELAAELGVDLSEVSRIVSSLVRQGVMRTERNGASVRYFVSPLIGTHLSKELRAKAQRDWKLPTAGTVGFASMPGELRRRSAPARPALAL